MSVALTILLAVLYVAEQFANSPLGCRVANVFRYYLVLVSLFWNGIEAHNMYRMLVKVFNVGESHYVVKAAVIAWGIGQLRFYCLYELAMFLPTRTGHQLEKYSRRGMLRRSL